MQDVSWLKEIETQLEKYESSMRVILNNFYSSENISLTNDDHMKLLKDIESLETDIIECETRIILLRSEIKSLRTDAEDGKDSDVLINKVSVSKQFRLFNCIVDSLKNSLNKITLIKKLFNG